MHGFVRPASSALERRRLELCALAAAVYRLKLDEKDLKENLRVWIDENLNIEVTITKAWKVKGREGKEIIGAECENETMKKDIMLNENKLKGRDIYIDRDMTWQQREIRRKLKERAKAEKEQGKKAVVKGDSLIINSKIYKWSEKEQKIFQTEREWKEKE
ncbi:hypothetical protein QAD02_003648 [Eretmocerus hayati]|uniref:Uncharacterized protein n=1 Tax=Eretmocerus hayati TaxID=131215 RepID=A0ACC2NMS2_9HYME|nr:hypothetical protein QAD02_003648 [Eretmocerus hayati]